MFTELNAIKVAMLKLSKKKSRFYFSFLYRQVAEFFCSQEIKYLSVFISDKSIDSSPFLCFFRVYS